MPNPDITTGSAVGGGGRRPGRPHKPTPKPPPPSAVGRPAPKDPDRIKLVPPKIQHPIDEIALRRQRLLKHLGHPIVSDGHWGPRSRFAWNQVGLPEDGWDRERGIEKLATEGAAQLQGVRQQAAAGVYVPKVGNVKPDDKVQNLRRIHELIRAHTPGALRAAQALADATGLTRPSGKTLHQASHDWAAQLEDAEITRLHKAAVNRQIFGMFRSLDDLTLARVAARGVSAPGLAALGAGDLTWLLTNDGKTLPQRFTYVVRDRHGKPLVGDDGQPQRAPTAEFIKGLQGYANRMGVRIAGKELLVDGHFDSRTADALKEAGRREQHAQEMVAYKDLEDKVTRTGAWQRAQEATGTKITFTDAWRKARDHKASFDVINLMSVALRQAEEDEPQRLFQNFKLAQEASRLGLFSGTTYGLDAPGSTKIQSLVSGIAPVLALSESAEEYRFTTEYFRTLAIEAEFAEDHVRGTAANDAVEYLVRRQMVPVLNPDGSVKMQHVAGTRGGVSAAVPVMEARLWNEGTNPRIVPAGDYAKRFTQALADGDAEAAAGLFFQSMLESSATAPATPKIISGAHELGRPAEWVTLQVVAASMQAKDIWTTLAHTDVRESFYSGALEAGTARDHSYDAEARLWFEQQGFWTQMALTALFDPLNFVGKGAKGVAILGRELERFSYKASERVAEHSASRQLARHGPSIVAEDELVARNRVIAASIVGPDQASPARLQFRPLEQARKKVVERKQVARMREFSGMRGVKPESIRNVQWWRQAATRSIEADPAMMHALPLLKKHKMSFFVSESADDLSDVGLRELAVGMLSARPAMLNLLRQHKYSAELDNKIPDYVFDLVEGGVHPEIAAELTRIESAFREQIIGQMKIAELSLRAHGNYQFVEEPGYTFTDGQMRRVYRGPKVVDDEAREVRQYYDDLHRHFREGRAPGETVTVDNPSFAIAMSRDEMEASVKREVDRGVNERMVAWRESNRRTLVGTTEDDMARVREIYEHDLRREVEAHYLPGGGATKLEQRLALDVLRERVALANRAREAALRNRNYAIVQRNAKAQQLADLIQSEGLSGKLANELKQLGLKGRLDHAADAEAADDSLEKLGLSADEALVVRARRIVQEHTGSFDPRMAVAQFNTPEMLKALEEATGRVLRDLNGGEIPQAFQPDFWGDTVTRYVDAEHPSLRVQKWYEFGPGKKAKPHASHEWTRTKDPKAAKYIGKIKTWEPTNAATAAVYLHEVAHTMAWPIGGRPKGETGELWDELMTSLIANRLRQHLFPDLDDESVALFEAALAQGFQTYYYSIKESKAAAMLFDAAQNGVAGFSNAEVAPFVRMIADMDAELPAKFDTAESWMTPAERKASRQEGEEQRQAVRKQRSQAANKQFLTDVYNYEQAVKAGVQHQAVDGTKDMEPKMREVLAWGMTAGLARRGLVLSEETLDGFFQAVAREGLDVRHPDAFARLVGKLDYQHPEVRDAYAQLDEAERLASREFKEYFHAREHRTLDLTGVAMLKEASKAATDNYWRTSDALFSKLLRLTDQKHLTRMALEFEGEYMRLGLLANPTREQRMLAIIHRASALSLRGYLKDGPGDLAELKEVNRAVTMTHRELAGLQRDVRLHSASYVSAAKAQRSLEQRSRDFTGGTPAGTWFDTRRSVEIPYRPTVGTRGQQLGKVHDAADGVAWANGERMQVAHARSTKAADVSVPHAPRPGETTLHQNASSLDLTHPGYHRKNVYVKASDFTVDARGIHHFDGDLIEGYVIDPETGKNKAVALPGDAIAVNELAPGQLFQIFQEGKILPSDTLRPGPTKLFYGDETRGDPSAFVQVPIFKNGKAKATQATVVEARRSVPPQIADAIRYDLQRQIEAGGTLTDLDTRVIEAMAQDNPDLRVAVNLFAHRQVLGMALRGHDQAVEVAAREAMPELLAQEGLYISAMSYMDGKVPRVAYATINGSLQLWKFAALAGSATWLLANVIDNFAKRLISGLVDPKEMMLAPVRTGAKATGMLAHFSVAAIRQGAKQGDRMFGTNVAEQLDGMLRAVTHYDAKTRNTFLRAHGIETLPREVEEGSFTISISSPLDVGRRRFDPLDWKAPWREYRKLQWGYDRAVDVEKANLLWHSWMATMWHVVGDMPENAARRAAYNVALRKGLKKYADLPEGERGLHAIEYAIHRVNQTLFDYNDIKVGEENLRFLFPFFTYWRKNVGYWSREVPQHPWIVSNLQRMEDYRSDPALPEGKDPLARYFDVTGVVDSVFDHLGIDVDVPGVAWDPVKLTSLRVVYELMFSNQNPNLPPEQGGIEIVNRFLSYFDDIGLGINPYLRAGLQATDAYEAESWRNIFPQTGLTEALTRSFWHEQFPDGINIERFLLDPAYERFHDGKSLSDLREEDINYYVQVEMSRQAAAGQRISRTKAERDVRGFFGVAALVQMAAGVYLRRMSQQDHELQRIRQTAKDDFKALTPQQMAVNSVDRERFKSREIMDRAVESYPYVELYYRTADYKQRQQLLELHPEISPYVQRTRSRDMFETPLLEGQARARRVRDQVLATQRALVMQIYQDLKQTHMTGTMRSRLYSAMMTPDLQEYIKRTQTPRSMADAFVRGEYYHYAHRVNEAFHDIPETDYARRQEFLNRNPFLSDYWNQINPPEKDAVSILNAANASYRSWYFAVKDAEGWDAAAPILAAHPQMFDFTSAAGKVDRATGKWLPRNMSDLRRHAADYLKFKPLLDEYFNTPKAARAHWLAGHPEVKAYFRTYAADKGFRRRHFHHRGPAGASAPWAKRRAEFWHRFFALSPDKRVKFIEQHAAEFDVFSWGPTADTAFTADAHAFAWGDTPRKEAYKQVAALMQVYFELKPEDRPFFLTCNPEIQAYFEAFSTKSPTGDEKLDKVLEAYFKTPHDLQPAYLEQHPELKDYFTSKRKTPEEKAIGILLDAYFGLNPAMRPDYLLKHPELAGFFAERKAQKDLTDAYDDALTEADPRYRRYRESEPYLRARAEIHLRRAALRAQTVERATTTLSVRSDREPADAETVRSTRVPTS